MQQPLVCQWFEQLRAQNRSANSIVASQRDLSALACFLSEQDVLWEALDKHLLHAYINTRLERDALSVSSVQRELSSLRQFYHWLQQHDAVQINPFLGFKLKRPARPIPDMVDVDMLSQLLDQPAPDNAKQAETWQRDRAMLELLYSSGIRVAELVNLQLADIDLTGKKARVTGKGNKTRIVPLGSKAVDAIQVWLLVRLRWKSKIQKGKPAAQRKAHQKKLGVEDALFVSQRSGTQLTTRSVQLRVTHQAARAGIDKRMYPHLLRHCFASHMLSASGDLRAVQELLGHANISTTQVYTHLDFEQLTSVYDGAHPRAKKNSP